MRLLVGSLVGLLVGKSYHTKQKDGNNSPTNDPTNNRTNWIWIGLKCCYDDEFCCLQEFKYLPQKIFF